MLNKNIFRFASWLLAFSLLLGLAVTGCSDNDKGGKVDPDPELSYVYYHFEMPDGNKAIGGAPTNVMVKGYDADGNSVDAKVTDGVIADLDEDAKGLKVAETTFAEDADTLVYCFYHSDNGVNVSDAFETVSVDGVEAGDDVYANPAEEEYTVAMETLALVDGKLETATEFKVGDDIYVKVYAVDANGAQTLMDQTYEVKVISSSDAVTVGDYDATQKAYKCQAKEVAKNVELAVKACDLQATSTTVSVKAAGLSHVYFMTGGATSYLDKDGHLVELSAGIIKSLEQMSAASSVRSREDQERSDSTFDNTFYALAYAGDDDNGWPLFTTDGVPTEATAACKKSYGEGVTFTASYVYEDGVGKLIIRNSGTVEGEPSEATCWLETTDEYDSDICTLTNIPGV